MSSANSASESRYAPGERARHLARVLVVAAAREMKESGAEAQHDRREQAHDEQSNQRVHGAAQCSAGARRRKLPGAA